MLDILKPLDLDNTESKARSRRALKSKAVAQKASNPPVTLPQLPKASLVSLLKLTQTLFKHFRWKSYLIYFPILVIGLLSYAATAFIFLTIEPRSIQHVLLTNSYAPLIIVSGMAHFALFSYLLLNSRRGAVISLVLSVLLFLQLQQILTQQLATQVVVSGVVIELTVTILSLVVRALHPRLQTLHDKLPRLKGRKTQDVDLAPPAADIIDPPPTAVPQRKRGRKRQHHFFGK